MALRITSHGDSQDRSVPQGRAVTGNEVMCQMMEEESKWVHCPVCRTKTRTKVYEDTVLVKFPLYCQKCKKEYLIDVVKLKMVFSDEPDA